MTSALANETKGYTTKAVVARLADMDVDAAGNAERAAWKRYLSLCLLAIAKGMDKKELTEAVFGKGGKASKTFQNMWSMANKCRHVVIGNRAWSDLAVMGIEDAMSESLTMINRHMAMLGVSGKNAYEPLCNLTMLEVDAKREADKVRDAQEAQAKADEAEKTKADGDKAEKAAKGKADTAPERTPAQAAIGALQEASRDDVMTVIGHLLGRVSLDDLRLIHETAGAMVENMAAASAKAIDAKAA